MYETRAGVEQAAHGWLTARSLRDPAMRSLLEHARPNWRWEPTLLEIGDHHIRAFTGLAMRVRLLTRLGPHRTWRVMQALHQEDIPLHGVNLRRRELLKQGGILLAGTALFQWSKLLQLGNQSHTRSLGSEPPPGVEEYAGFLLLPEGTLVPSFVRYPERGIPVFCGVGDAEIAAVSQSLTGAEDLVKQLGFPIYTFRELPNGLRPIGANLIRYKTGEVYAASVNFGSFDQSNNSRGMVSITAQPDFPRPFPLRSSASVEPGGPAVILQKVSFLPSPGIMVATYKGYIFFWIEEDILYTLLAEHSPSREEVQALAGSLVLLE